MKRVYSKSSYARPLENYCREQYPTEIGRILDRAEEYYREFYKEMPDLGENLMASNMLDWYTIVSFYEATDHRLDGEALLLIKQRAVDRQQFLGRIINGNTQKWPYRIFHWIYTRYARQLAAHQARGEWKDAWRVEINPEHRTEGFAFHLVGCPIARHAREHGYEDLLPYLCRTDHMAAQMMHTRLIRKQTEILGGDYCDYWYVGDQSPVLEKYRDLPLI